MSNKNTMDWSWMDKPRDAKEYYDGVDEFISFAYGDAPNDRTIKCPCRRCVCSKRLDRETMRQHLYFDGVIKDKEFWKFHGESLASEGRKMFGESGMHEMLRDVFGMKEEDKGLNKDAKEIDENAIRFYKLVKDAGDPLYPGCVRHSKLSFIIRMFNIKCMGGWSNSSFELMLKLVKEILPDGDVLPNSLYELKKVIKDLGYGYEKIHSCPNDCLLYWKENENLDSCPKCGECRWKSAKVVNSDESDVKKVPKKVLRHFPIIPRLQRMYMSSKHAINMRWHGERRQEDGRLRHPADSPCWKTLDAVDDFGLDVRNVRLGLASDGFNPFSTMSISHSTWPVVLIPYNLPPWECMKSPNIFLSLLIPGPKGPGNDLDIYLQPLVEELQMLWHGIDTFDASTGEMFRMRAALLWTINDFPAYACLSGWSTKGRLACPVCNKDTCSSWLHGSGKHFYHGHRRWLPSDHKFRSMTRMLDGRRELGETPRRLSGDDVLEQLEGLNFTLGKVPRPTLKKKRSPLKKLRGKGKRRQTTVDSEETEVHKYLNWKKCSIFFELPYWKFLLIRHNLDVMHIEKNVCDSIVGTLLGIDGKSKDGLKARQDLENLGIRHSLHPKSIGPSKILLPPARFTLSKGEKQAICNVFKNVKVPDGYSSNISRHVDEKKSKIWGLKSHDCHVLLQQILPVALRGLTQKEVSSTLIDVSNFFVELCSKSSTTNDFFQLGERITITLCRLEMIFLPSFFDIMVHLLIHLSEEARLGGPVHYRWMYPIERYLARLKSYVRNKACPEGSIAEGYLAEETLTFASRYLDDDVDTWFNRPIRNECNNGIEVDDEWDIFSEAAHPLGAGTTANLDLQEQKQAHQYVLFNCDAIASYREQHLSHIRSEHPRASEMEIERVHSTEFAHWFKHEVHSLQERLGELVSPKLRWLKDGPLSLVKKYNGCLVNGFRFHTQNVEQRRRTQNSGVVLCAMTPCSSSSQDKNLVYEEKTYYGVLGEIIQLYYYGEMKVLLFKCNWFDVTRGVKEENGFTLVNPNHMLRTTEPFVFASQVEQVWFVKDPGDSNWFVVRKTRPRDLFDMVDGQRMDEGLVLDIEPMNNNAHVYNVHNDEMNMCWERNDVEGMEIMLETVGK